MGPFAVLASVAAIAAPATTAASAPTLAPEVQTAQCVAALDVSTRQLAARVREGQHALQPLLLARLKSGAAFIGAAYLAGERDEARTRMLLEAALEAQQALSEQELAARQAACEAEGARLLADASALERAVVRRVAARRMQRLLAE